MLHYTDNMCTFWHYHFCKALTIKWMSWNTILSSSTEFNLDNWKVCIYEVVGLMFLKNCNVTTLYSIRTPLVWIFVPEICRTKWISNMLSIKSKKYALKWNLYNKNRTKWIIFYSLTKHTKVKSALKGCLLLTVQKKVSHLCNMYSLFVKY